MLCGLLLASVGCTVLDMPTTDLCVAAEQGNVELTNELIRRGDNVNEPDSNGWLPLAWAARGNGAAVVPILVKAGADINRSCHGRTPLLHAIAFQRETVGRQLLASGANVNARQEKDGYTGLMMAAESSQLEFEEILLANGADPYITAPDGADALTLAISGTSPHSDFPMKYCHTASVRLLMQRYPDLTIPKTPWGALTLQRAREGYCEEILSMIHLR
jgi:hypothetical protein